MAIHVYYEDLKSNNLALNEAIDVAQNCPVWCLRLALRTPSGACQKRRRILATAVCHSAIACVQPHGL